jgi:hypothetical protein
VPPLSARRDELGRIVDEFAQDAIGALDAPIAGFPDVDRAWVLKHDAATLPDIEKATLRLVAIRAAGSIEGAAERLGMSGTALRHWVRHRRAGRRGEVRP